MIRGTYPLPQGQEKTLTLRSHQCHWQLLGETWSSRGDSAAVACPHATSGLAQPGALGLSSQRSQLVTVHPSHTEFTLLTLILFCSVTSAKSFPLSVSSVRPQSEAEKGAKLVGQIGIEPVILTPLVHIEPAGRGQHR